MLFLSWILFSIFTGPLPLRPSPATSMSNDYTDGDADDNDDDDRVGGDDEKTEDGITRRYSDLVDV